MIKAPSVTNLKVALLSANHIKLKWDDIGSNFFYIIDYALTRDSSGTTIPPDKLGWLNVGRTIDEQWYSDKFIQPDTYYKFRVASSYKGFEQSDWVETGEILSFEQNAYYISAMEQFTPSNKFIEEKFIKNQEYINFNQHNIQATLMNERFVFDPDFSHLSNISNYIIVDKNYHEIQDHIEAVCFSEDRVMLGEIDGVLYLFERFQNYVKVSNDKGQTWKYYKAFNDRVGNPVSRTVVCQSSTATYVLGYDQIFYGTRSSDARWSSDIERMSNNEITFAKDNSSEIIGFDTEKFRMFAMLPPIINKKAEAFACSDDFVYVGGRNTIRKIRLKNTPIDQDPGSPTFGQRLFDPEVIKVSPSDNIVIKKMETLIDSETNKVKLLILVSGCVKTPLADPTIIENVLWCEHVGVYMMDTETLEITKVFGKTEYERSLINHEYSNMSSDGHYVSISTPDYHYAETTPDNLIHEDVTSSVKYKTPIVYTTTESIYFNNYKTVNGVDWISKPNDYYNEADYTWMRRGGTRCWITPDNRPLVVYPETIYTKNTDIESNIDDSRINSEIHEIGRTILKVNNVSFDGFYQYSNGMLFHSEDGKIIGYYQFPYRVRDYVSIIWKPQYTMMVAELTQQIHDDPYTAQIENGIVDPDLTPLVVKMCPENYLTGNFDAFSKYYLKFISEGTNSAYNQLLNLIRNQFPLETNNFTYLWSEIKKRNIYIDKEKRDAVAKFFEARSTDFYSSKGIEDSYKFLFKILYNEEVELEIESKASMEYDITVYSDNINDDIVGRTIYSPTGRCNVTYIEREYKEGKLQWNITIHNMIGKFLEGQNIKSENSSFTGQIIRGIRGKDIPNIGQYPERGKTYYVMKIKSQLPMSRYNDDVIRFVHPVGFGFIGITMITVFINSGLSMKHYETIINLLKTYKWDSGYPLHYPDVIAKLDINGNIMFDPKYGEAIYIAHPKAGQDFVVPPEYDKEEKPLNDVLPSARRVDLSPLFDSSTPSYSFFRNLVDKRLKDDNNLPRDPKNPTQVKV